MKIIDPNFYYLKSDFYSAVIQEILNGCVVKLYMSSLIMTLCCIDYMGIPLSNNTKNTNIHFKMFLENYMADANPKYKDSNLRDKIYAVRCSLVHSFGEADALQKLNFTPKFKVGIDDNEHLLEKKDTKGNNNIYISILHIISETIAGVEKFFRQVNNVTTLTEWYKRLYILGGVSGGLSKLSTVSNGNIIHKNIHPYLEILDNPRSSINDISISIKNKLLENYHNT